MSLKEINMNYYITTTGTGPVEVTPQDSRYNYINREEYERDLKRRQQEHLDSIGKLQEQNWRPCMHDSCPECVGTGQKKDGSFCIHNLSCPCPRCTPSF